MFGLLKRENPLVEKAKEGRRGFRIVLELLIFAAVFMAGNIVPEFVELGLMLPKIFEIVKNAVTTGEIPGSAQIMTMLMSGGALVAATLFLTVFQTAACVLYCRFIEKRSLESMGFTRKRPWLHYIIGLATGFLLISTTIGLGLLLGGFEYKGSCPSENLPMVAVYFLGYMLQGLSEEVMCRGYLMISLARRQKLWVSIIVSALVFAALHLLNPGVSLLAVINLFLFGVLFSLYTLSNENIWGAAALHTMWNFAQGCFFGLSVSGLGECESIFRFSVTDNNFVSGGAFGPEGGIAVTIVTVLGICVILLADSLKNCRKS